MFDRVAEFERLIEVVGACRRCQMMNGCTRVLSWANGSPRADVMFVGEAPGRLGADRTAVPFHGDVAGDNFERLLALAGLTRREVFVTNAVLCNPKDETGNNAPPTKAVIRNCADNLEQQIAVVQPRIVVTLGAAALEATRIIEQHELALSLHVRTSNSWFGRTLIPLYHPGARAMIHRNFATQTADYYFVGEASRRKGAKPKPSKSVSKPNSIGWDVVRYILSYLGESSLFRLHKIMYLIEVKARKAGHQRFTGFFYIRQKDGPYCVELGSRWFKHFGDALQVKTVRGNPVLRWRATDLFSEQQKLDQALEPFLKSLLEELRGLNESELKTRSYLTEPMKRSLREERAGLRQLNRPLL